MPIYFDELDLYFSDYTIDGHGEPAYSAYTIDNVWVDFTSMTAMNFQIEVKHQVTGKRMTPKASSLKELAEVLGAEMDRLDKDAYEGGFIEETTSEHDWWVWAEEAVRFIFGL